METEIIINQKLEQLWRELEKVIVSRRKELYLILVALLSEGHVLLEDFPGTGKTTMVKAFAKGINCKFNRIQCTPDLLPSDILGGSIYNPKTGEFLLRKGPVFTNILLVDEINRTLPRTQSSLLECMEERQISLEGHTYDLDIPFIVLATQNPIEMEGTFTLPEAQMDRFLIKLKLGYPSQEDEELMLTKVGDEILYHNIIPVFSPEEICKMQNSAKNVFIHPEVVKYITTLSQATRNHPLVAIGTSPRATKAIYKAAKSLAFLKERDYVIPDDVKELIKPVWNHRLILKPETALNNIVAEDILNELIEKVGLPEEKVLKHVQ